MQARKTSQHHRPNKMNFLLHRALATAESRDPIVGLGATLPDLWRMAHRRMRAKNPRSVHRAPQPAQDIGERLCQGVEHHLEADRWFHQAPVFLEGERATAERLRSLGAPKLGLFGHIAWELCLDGAWLLEQEHPQQVHHAFGNELETAGSEIWHVAAHFGSGRLGNELPQFRKRLQRISDALKKPDWIMSYGSGAGLRDRIAGLRLHLGLAALDSASMVALEQAMSACLSNAQQALPALYAERKNAAA